MCVYVVGRVSKVLRPYRIVLALKVVGLKFKLHLPARVDESKSFNGMGGEKG